jgi:hypothetical protein
MAVDAASQIAAQEAYFNALQNGQLQQQQPYYQQQTSQSTDLMRSLLLQQQFDRINQTLAVERQAADNAIAHMLPAFLAYPALAQIANDAEALSQVVANYHELVNYAIAYGDGMREIAQVLDSKLQNPDFLLEHAFQVWGQYNLNDQAKALIAQKFMALMGETQQVEDRNYVPNSVSAAQLATMQRSAVPIPPVPAEMPSQQQVSKMDVLRNTMTNDDAYAVLNSLKQRR